MSGWCKHAIEIDLGSGSIRKFTIPEQDYADFIGGRGLGVKLLSDRLAPHADAFSSPIIITTGPVTGTPAPFSGRHTVTAKSPLTNTIFDCSAGGFLGRELKFAGYDAIVVSGESDAPVYIEINDNAVQIKPASHLWGLNVRDTTSALSDTGKVMCIGRAGEREVLMANIMNDFTHAAGRGGLGALMGRKKLKAMVVKGSTKPIVHDLEMFKEAKSEIMRLIKANPVTSKGLAAYGTVVLVNLMNYMDILPTKNFTSRHFDNAESISGEYIKANYDLKNHACYNCPIACRRIRKDGVEIPEYESLWALGPACDNSDMDSIIDANRLCNEYGIDTISCGSTIAAFKELEDSDKSIVELVKAIGEGDGGKEGANDNGDACTKIPLGSGSKRYSEAVGRGDVSMSSKGLEFPGYDPRGIYGQALGYATSNRGGCHLRAYMVAPEVIGKPKLIDRLTFSGKAGLVNIFQNLAATVDSLAVCKFSSFALSEEEYAKLLTAITGVNYTSQTLLKTGERIWNLERLFNIGAGFTRADDTLPDRLFGNDGLNKNEFNAAIGEYYHYRGWNEDGIPSLQKLKELGLDGYAHFINSNP